MALPANLPFPVDAPAAPAAMAARPARPRLGVRLDRPAWLSGVGPLARKAGVWFAAGCVLLVLFALVIAVCGELGWFVGWATGEVVKMFMTHAFTDMGADLASAWAGQMSALQGVASTIAQYL